RPAWTSACRARTWACARPATPSAACCAAIPKRWKNASKPRPPGSRPRPCSCATSCPDCSRRSRRWRRPCRNSNPMRAWRPATSRTAAASPTATTPGRHRPQATPRPKPTRRPKPMPPPNASIDRPRLNPRPACRIPARHPHDGPSMIRSALLVPTVLTLAAAPAVASECRHSAPRSLELDLAGTKTVMFDVGPHELRVDAGPLADTRIGTLAGQACASDADRLDALTVTQERDGDRLIVRLRRDDALAGFGLGKRYAYLRVEAGVPDDVLVQLQVGSGDAWLAGAAAASADVGSGDVELKRIVGRATVKVG